MAGDLDITERAVLEGAALPSAAAPAWGTTIHRYGRVRIAAAPGPADDRLAPGAAGFAEPLDGLSEVEQLGVAALQLRESEGYRAAKRNRPRAEPVFDAARMLFAEAVSQLNGSQSQGRSRGQGQVKVWLAGKLNR